MLMWGTTGRSTWLAPGMPASCSRKKHTALPRSAHEPPPNDTTTSIPSRRAWSTACCTSGTGTCDCTSAKVDASARPSSFTTRWPSGEADRPAVVTSRALRAPSTFTSSGSRSSDPSPEHELLGERGVGPGLGHSSPAKRSSSRWSSGTPWRMNHS